MTFDYSYSTSMFETIKIPDDLKIDKVNCIKKAMKKAKPNDGVTQANYLNNTDFVWSKYKYCHIA